MSGIEYSIHGIEDGRTHEEKTQILAIPALLEITQLFTENSDEKTLSKGGQQPQQSQQSQISDEKIDRLFENFEQLKQNAATAAVVAKINQK
jgi:hypothetical protein